jgi:hypothetical protein
VKKNDRAVLTIAVGKPLYRRLAINLLRSLLYWHPESDLRFVLATDQTEPLPSDLASVEIVALAPRQYGEGFSPKLHLDRLGPAEKTLFVDADCLCVGSVDSVFARFKDRAVSVVGGAISQGEWFGDVESVCQRFAVRALPKFNGGIYYVEKGDICSSVYSKARELEEHYDSLGLVRLREKPNDELLIAISMAIHGLKAIPDDGSVLSSPFEAPTQLEIDVFKGRSVLVNPFPPNPQHQSWYPLHEVHPVLVHFLGDHHSRYEYCAEAFKLRFWNRNRLVLVVLPFMAMLFITWPGQMWQAAKNALRPAYRRCFGVRRLKPSERI